MLFWQKNILSVILSKVYEISSVILQFDANLRNWLKNEKFSRILRFCFDSIAQNKNAESVELLKKIISEQEKVTRALLLQRTDC